MKPAEPLPISELDAAQREATNDYCTNTEFKCLLDGGDPKSTIYNLRAMAHSCGFEKGVKWLIEKAKKNKNNCLYYGKDGLSDPVETDTVLISDLEELIKGR